jgi:hypothetical protein
MNNSNKQQKVYILLKDLPDHKKGTEFYWDSARGKYKTLLETVNGAEPYSCYMGKFVENNPEWFKEKQQPIVEERIVVSHFNHHDNFKGNIVDSFFYQFCSSKPIPKEKHEAVKQAIEKTLNGENDKQDSKEEQKPILFTTEDGKPVYIGETYWKVTILEQCWKADEMLMRIELSQPPSYFKYFSTKEAAEQYILENKPCLSMVYIISYGGGYDTRGEYAKVYTEELKKLANTKINKQ